MAMTAEMSVAMSSVEAAEVLARVPVAKVDVVLLVDIASRTRDADVRPVNIWPIVRSRVVGSIAFSHCWRGRRESIPDRLRHLVKGGRFLCPWIGCETTARAGVVAACRGKHQQA